MNFIEQFLIWLDSSMINPVSYGWFHILFLILTIISIVIIKYKYNNLSDSQIRKTLLYYSIICLLLEVYKQVNFSFNYDAINTWWSYQWYAFPFQFCSTPMYIAFISCLIKNDKIKYALYAFLASYGLLAGLLVMLYPVTVFVDTIGINLQTMIHHGSMLTIGSLLIINKRIKLDFKTLLSATKVFISLLLIANIANIITYYINIDGGLKLFFISPFHESSLPVFSSIYNMVPYPIFLLIYTLSFMLGAYLIMCISRKVIKYE